MLIHRVSGKDRTHPCDPLSLRHEEGICEYKALANSLNVDLSFDPVADTRVSDEVG